MKPISEEQWLEYLIKISNHPSQMKYYHQVYDDLLLCEALTKAEQLFVRSFKKFKESIGL